MIDKEIAGRMPAWFDDSGTDTDTVVSTRIRLARNLARHSFPARASLFERMAVYKEVSDAVGHVEAGGRFFCVNFSAVRRVEQEFFVEQRSASPDLLDIEGERGVAFDEAFETNIMINEEDHLRIQCMGSGYCPDRIWQCSDELDDRLGRQLEFAYDARRGFLTACPTNSGTGLRVSFLMHLPGLVLTKTIDQVLQGCSRMGISTRGFFGEHSEIVGHFFQLSNHTTMGASETEFLEQTRKTIRHTIDMERQARDRVRRTAGMELTDKVYRAYGILVYARTLEMKEFLNLASAVRLGLEIGLFSVLSIGELNRLTLSIMPAHMQLLRKRGTKHSPAERPAEERAAIVRNFFGTRGRLKERGRPRQGGK